MQNTLISELGLAGGNPFETASAYLAEDGATTARRGALEQKKERIRDVMNKLYRFGA